MEEEIKEILDDFKWYIEQKNEQDINGEYEYPRELTQEEAKILLDYITNLQEENEELEAKLEMYENGVYFSSENDKLQEKIDKAIEILEEADYWDNIGNVLLPLLKGNGEE